MCASLRFFERGMLERKDGSGELKVLFVPAPAWGFSGQAALGRIWVGALHGALPGAWQPRTSSLTRCRHKAAVVSLCAHSLFCPHPVSANLSSTSRTFHTHRVPARDCVYPSYRATRACAKLHLYQQLTSTYAETVQPTTAYNGDALRPRWSLRAFLHHRRHQQRRRGPPIVASHRQHLCARLVTCTRFPRCSRLGQGYPYL
jgi:hypothetical protein